MHTILFNVAFQRKSALMKGGKNGNFTLILLAPTCFIRFFHYNNRYERKCSVTFCRSSILLKFLVGQAETFEIS